MRYEEFYKEYQKKYQKRKKLLIRVLIYSFIGVILIGVFLTLFLTSGNAYDYTLKGWAYGEANVTAPKAFLATADYQFYVDGSWTTEIPTIPGEYEYRVRSKGLFGRETYSDTDTFTIAKRKALVQCNESTILYGNQPTASGVLFEGDSLVSYDFIYESMVLAETKVHVNKDTIVVKNAADENVTEYYEFDTPETNIKFTEVPIVIALKNAEKTYDGTPLTSSAYEVTGELVNGDSIVEVKTSGSQLYAGESENTITDVVIQSASGLKVENYRVEVIPAKLEVFEMEIHIYTSEVTDATFDGTVHTYNTISSKEVIPDKLLAEESIEVIYAGTYDYVLTPVIKNSADEIVTQSYKIVEQEFAKIHILPSDITITPEAMEEVYSGKKKYTCEPVIEGSTYGATIKISVESDIIYAGTGTTTITELKATLGEDEVDVTESFHFTRNTGVITITRKPITIAAKDATKEYDNKAYSSKEYELTGDLVGKDSLTVSTSCAETELCEDGVIQIDSYSIKNGSLDVTSSYEITPVAATLKITKRAITVKVENSVISYGDTESIKVKTGSGSLLSGHKIIPVFKSYTKDIGKNTVEIDTYEILDAEDHNVATYYEVSDVLSGTLTVNKRKLTVATKSKTVTYTGTAHTFTKEDIYLKSGTLLAGETLSFISAPAGEITNVGSVKSSLAMSCLKLTDSSDQVIDMDEYYDVTFENGSIKVNQKIVYIESGSKICDYEYDITLVDHSYTVTGLAAGDAVNPVKTIISGEIHSEDEKITVRGTNTISKVVIENLNGDDVTENYDIVKYEGTLIIVGKGA